MYQAVLFDLDGTLTNTLEDIAFAMNRALRLHGLPEHPVDAYRYMVGDGAKVLAQRAAGDRGELAEDVRQTYQAYYQEHNLDRTRPYEGIPELLAALRRRGVKLCVFSNKPHADTCRVVKHFFPEIDFDVVRGQLEGVPVKPDPAGALAAAEDMGVPPENFLYLGDTDVDMICAHRAGMHPVGVAWGFRTAEELLNAGAERLIQHPMELIM
ncbi:MAG: HAD family hydrolase [Clostridiales bacterium]|nr:HAD family hydrolase [Clostridiales bacterium]